MFVTPKMAVAVIDITFASKAEKGEIKEEEQALFVLFIRETQTFLDARIRLLLPSHCLEFTSQLWAAWKAAEVFFSLYERNGHGRRGLRMDVRLASQQCLSNIFIWTTQFSISCWAIKHSIVFSKLFPVGKNSSLKMIKSQHIFSNE